MRGVKGTAGQKQLDMIGQKFGRLLVLSYDEETSKRRGSDHYLCRCNCSIKLIVGGNSLRSGHTKSCGCLLREIMSKLCRSGENNPNYLDGFYVGFKKFCKTVRERDKVCQYNNGSECKGQLEAHHLDGDNANNDSKNGALLCIKHHGIVRTSNNVWRPKE